MKMKSKPNFFSVNLKLTWITAIGSFTSVVGIVIVATELFKYQTSIRNAKVVVGAVMMAVGLAMNFLTLCYQAFKQIDATAGPINVCSNCLNFLLGLSLLIVAHILPLSVMFGFLAHKRIILSSGKESFSIFSKSSWSAADSQLDDLENFVQLRVTTFAVALIVLGAAGFFISCTVTLRIHTKKKQAKKVEEARRKGSQNKHTASKPESGTWKAIQVSKRGSVYDYTAWDSRSKDLFSDKPMQEIEEEEAQTSAANNDGSFNQDLISESRFASGFAFTSPFEKASTMIKGARRFTDTLLPSSAITQNLMKPKETIELRSASAQNCEYDRKEMLNLSPSNLTAATFRRSTSCNVEVTTHSV